MRSELSHIAQVSRTTLDCLSRVAKISSVPSRHPEVNNHPIHPLNLRPAETYLSGIQRPDLPDSAQHLCSRSLKSLACRIQETYERTAKHCAMSASHLNIQPPEQVIGALRRLLEDTYHKQCLQIVQRADKYLAEILPNEKLATVTKRSKPIFNHKYTPLLEQYFEYNAYPSGSDKAMLARRTGMTQRQIDVWFQNHRNRAKKDGRPLRRPLDITVTAPLGVGPDQNKTPPAQILTSMAPIETETEESDSNSLMFTNHHMNASAQKIMAIRQEKPCAILDFPATEIPSHVFPAPYRQRDQPTPTKLPPVRWERVPSTDTEPRVPVDMEELISSFTLKLTIGDGHESVPRRRKAEQRTNSRNASWFASRITIAPTAPLPALHRTQKQANEVSEGRQLRQLSPYACETRSSSIVQSGLGPTRSCRRPRLSTNVAHNGPSSWKRTSNSGFMNSQRRKSSSSSIFSVSNSETSEDASSGSELLTPPTSLLSLPETTTDKTTPFDIYGWGPEP